MKIAVITPYHDIDSPYLSQCLASVQKQTHHDFIHVIIGDGCTLTNLEHFKSIHNIPLPKKLKDFGDSPRSIGVIFAFAMGADAVTFLDSDNWYAPEHLQQMAQTCGEFNSDIVTCSRRLCQLDGSEMGLCPESDGVIFCDTNCLLVTKTLAEEAGLWWLIPDDLHVIDDRVMWDTLIHATTNIAATGNASVYYRTAFEFHYKMFNLPLPENTKTGNAIAALGEIIHNLQQRAKDIAGARTEHSVPR